MKFSWKMILSVTLILALTLSLGGYTVIAISFDSEIGGEIQAAQNDMHLFSMLLQALSSTWQYREAEDGELQRILLSHHREGGPLSSYEFAVSDGRGKVLVRTERMRSPIQPPPKGRDLIETRILRQERELAVSTCSVELLGQVVCLQRERDVSDIFERARENLTVYQFIMLGLLALGVLLTAVFALILTRPLKRISRTARQLATGHYDKRVPVPGDDDLGQVARDFNAMADALEAKIHQLADALDRQKEFTASFAHELKTPLTSVIGYADTLRSRSLPPRKQFEAADYIVSEGKRLEAMSFALLDLFALEQEKPAFRDYPVSQLLEEVRKSSEYLLGEKKITLSVRAEEARLPMVPALLHTLLYNLVDNARKASPEGSVITILGEDTDLGYRLSVRDQGRGIPAEVLDRITEPFYMVDKSRARAQGGAGLGLALCSRIAELHGTELRFSSEVGKGTLVSLRLGGKKNEA